ncbi:hypothetical protein P280DRAFT_457567 [Massarina eburnea CBS 473.64]|uniref:DUF1446-domain-containing protein n=1 Tax=Massarina eburnea CBS 473.64 TaxID=1395130 RepID=A0A6A6RT55_9PLEO|nr:hypothetical protein P280DRAFT_457567 [Massarina eburnea CBS 473.64]
MSSPRPIVNIVTPVGMLGYGLKEEETYTALETVIANGAPTAIVLDSGSTDSGPEKLALGYMSTPRQNYARDLRKLVRLGRQFGVPVIFSSAGGDGSDKHVSEVVKIIEEIAGEEGNETHPLKTIAIYSEVQKPFLHSRLASNAISGCGSCVPELTRTTIDTAPRICSQMGPEPFYDAMVSNPGFNILAGGRGYDPSPYIAYCAYASQTGFENTSTPEAQRMFGAFAHMGKIMECGAACARPKSNGATGTVYEDGSFDLVPNDPAAKCTPISVSAHSLYEKSRPDVLSGPGGALDLTRSEYEQLGDGRTVRVSGGRFVFSRDAGLKYQIKLEGARVVGYRAQYMGSYHDPILIRQLDSVLDTIRKYVEFQHEDTEGTWQMDWHIYGKDTVTKDGKPGEVFIIGEALAPTQELASSLVSTARVASVHVPYPGMKATAGAFAYGLGGKVELPLGPCAEFSIYHLVDLEDGEERLRSESNPNGLYWQQVSTFGTTTTPLSTSPSSNDESVPHQSFKQKRTLVLPQDIIVDEATLPTPKTLGDLASVLRSKNAGPFELTFDVMFKTEEQYYLVKEAGFLNAASMANLFGLKEEEIVWSGFFDQALAWKTTIPRLFRGKKQGNGGFMENDVHGSQKYMGLFDMELPGELVEKLEALKASKAP